jgi:hypothetical protein
MTISMNDGEPTPFGACKRTEERMSEPGADNIKLCRSDRIAKIRSGLGKFVDHVV